MLEVRKYPSGSPWIHHTKHHAVRYSPGNSLLLVTFDHLEANYAADEDPKPWAYDFAKKNGWSILGVISKKHLWFREQALFSLMRDIAASGLFKLFDRVIFAGGSKGGYGALAFSSLAPGCSVIAINPQSTLDIDLVPWEKRYPVAKWTPDFRDGAVESLRAEKVFLLYDPLFSLDRQHADRVRGANVKRLHCRYMGHGIATCFKVMGVLPSVMKMMIEDTFDDVTFYKLMRNRKKLQRYPNNVLSHARERGHSALAKRIEGK